jgi:predicted DsbA family dithiol-disulfide isomerase
MSPVASTLYFDYVDPLCYLLEAELADVLSEGHPIEVTRVPAEVCPPPGPLLDPDGPWWAARWQAAQAAAGPRGLVLAEPPLLPWTSKAHELVLHARQRDLGARAHAAVFDAIFGRGRDIGRVDVLVELAQELGLDAHEAKAVLDVDRYSDEVAALGARAAQAGVAEVPTLVRGSQTLQGFHNRSTLRTFLLR